jgi:hypothetical protein
MKTVAIGIRKTSFSLLLIILFLLHQTLICKLDRAAALPKLSPAIDAVYPGEGALVSARQVAAASVHAEVTIVWMASELQRRWRCRWRGATLAAQTCVAELINLFQPAALKKQFGSRKLKLSIEVLLLIQLFPAWHDEKVDDTIITMNKAAAVEDTVAIYRIPPDELREE